jgi:hypothetical protein
VKSIFIFLFSLSFYFAQAQKIDSIYVNLYTDSLKKGTYNYINIDGKMSNGKYLPLDSTHVALVASDGKFTGNDLWIPKDFKKDKVTIKAVLLSNTSICKTFTVYIKKMPDPELKTEQQLLDEMKNSPRKKRG